MSEVNERSRLDEAAASVLATYNAKQIASGGHEVWPPELAAQMRVDDMRAAILAALPILLGEPVAWAHPLDADAMADADIDTGNVIRLFPTDNGESPRVALYAPSLGEGGYE